MKSKKNLPYRQCALSVMDTIADPDISFNQNGVCNYYHEYVKKNALLPKTEEEAKPAFNTIIQKIKTQAAGKKYDSILGLSGGVDSTYIAWLAWKAGLRPLAVHFDNGWNTRIAEDNIANIIRHTGFAYKTVKMDGEEYRDIQRAYLKASVVDIEAPTDHAVFTTLFRMAGENGIRYTLNGTNHQTECTMPKSWNFSKPDHVNIRAIHRAYGSVPLKTFPLMDMKMKRIFMSKHKLESISLLHYVCYNKKAVVDTIKRDFDWQEYGGKHHESIWTRFYQAYIMPQKFGIDKRKAHLSDLIFGGQISKKEALKELAKPLYDPALLAHDKKLVCERLGFSEQEFEEIMATPPRSHFDFDYEMPLDKRYPVLKPLKKMYRMLRG